MQQFDKTSLSISNALKTGLVHKDYIAHCHRWAHVVKYLEQRDQRYGGNERYKHSLILDIGCGHDLMLYKILASNKMANGAKYIGVDINKIENPFANRKNPPTIFEETDFLTVELDAQPNVLVSFEVVEHVPREFSLKILQHAYRLAADDAIFFLSTPVRDEKWGVAKNHQNEMTREELMDQINVSGWSVQENYGTFATRADLYGKLTPEHKEVFDKLSAYYCGHVMATIFAPLYPQHSRNNIWVLVKQKVER
jgi:2-polyprenyl-3-methyl-5-hydroxy-6-metoxy-1,4-benzoquinol methylase